MASKLYEQAIIEATALKEAAVKNAQEAVLEKYSEQIKEAVSSVLEQDEEETLDREEELTSDIMGEPEMGLEAEDDLDMGLNVEPDPAAEAISDEEDMLGKEVPSALSASEEEIEIDLDKLSDMVDAEMESAELGIADEAGDISDKVEDFKDTVEDLKDAVEDIKAMKATQEHEEENVDEDDEAIARPSDFQEDVNYPESVVLEALESMLTREEESDEEEKKEDKEEGVEIDVGGPRERPLSHGGGKTETEYNEEHDRVMAATKKHEDEIKKKNEYIDSLREQVTKYEKTMKVVAEKVDKVNLQNAKLLYKNRVLEDNSLNERQRKQIVENISKTRTVKEAELIFETLQSAAQGSTERKERPESLHEVTSKRNSLFVKPGKNRETSDGSSSFSVRMKELAGIG